MIVLDSRLVRLTLCLGALLLGGAGCASADAPEVGGRPDASGQDSSDQLPLPDAGGDSTVTPTDCVLSPNSGCPAAQSCDLDANNLAEGGTYCRNITTAGTESGTCLDSSDCAKGFTCLGPAGASSCRRYCTGDPDCPGDGGICVIQIVYGDPAMPVPGGSTCASGCDPLTAAGCPTTGWSCPIGYHAASDRFYSQCRKAGAGLQDAACTANSDCAPNYECVTVTQGDVETQVCLKTCNVTAGTGCEGLAGAPTCQGYADPLYLGDVTAATPGAIQYGSCL